MVYQSTYALSHSLPNRSPSTRPRSLSLSGYQPLPFDREAIQSAYQAHLQRPTSSVLSSASSDHNSTGTNDTGITIPSSNYDSRYPSNAVLGIDTNGYKDSNYAGAGQGGAGGVNGNGGGNFAGLGAGHSLQSPNSPLHQEVSDLNRRRGSFTNLHISDQNQYNNNNTPNDSNISNVSNNQQQMPSSSPNQYQYQDQNQDQEQYRYDDDNYSNNTFGKGKMRISSTMQEIYKPDQPVSRSNGQRRGRSYDRDEMGDGHEGYESDPGHPRYVGGSQGGRRGLPPIPTNVPQPQPPQWEPDYKPQIPSELTQNSVQDAYAQLSAPPPGLPPRRGRGLSFGQLQPSSSSSPNMNSNYSNMAGPSSSHVQSQYPQNLQNPQFPQTPQNAQAGPSYPLPTGAPDYPPDPNSPLPKAPKPRRAAETNISLKSEKKTPIWSTHYLDPSLRNTVFRIPHQVTNVTNIALSGLSSGPKENYNQTIGAPIDGMAKLAKSWFVPPDARFVSDKGMIEVGLGVIDCGGKEGEESWGREKGRKRARVEVGSKAGGIKIDVIEVNEDRQVDLKVESKTGDVLLLLPNDFFGTIHVTTPGRPPQFCKLLETNLAPLAHPYETFYTTFVVPPEIAIAANAYNAPPDESNDLNDPPSNIMPDMQSPSTANLKSPKNQKQNKKKSTKSIEYETSLKLQKWVPDFLKGQGDILDQVIGGYAAHTRGEWSKIHISNGGRGRIVLGYRESQDEEESVKFGLKVGVEKDGKKKKWWQ